MNQYQKIIERQGEQVAEFTSKYMFFAFDEEQARAGAEKLGLNWEKGEDTDKLVYIGAGGYLLREQREKFWHMLNIHEREIKTACMNCGPAGHLLAFDMFKYEMFNHEYGLTWDDEEVLEVLPLTLEEIQSDPALIAAWNKARAHVINNTEC